jgi:hypothetical protein
LVVLWTRTIFKSRWQIYKLDVKVIIIMGFKSLKKILDCLILKTCCYLNKLSIRTY